MTSSLLMNETRLVADPSEQEGRKPFMRICGKDIRVEGRLVRIARIDGEKYTFPDNAEEMINELRKSQAIRTDRKSTRLNSSHGSISYAVFCLKKKKERNNNTKDKIRNTDQ